MKITFYKYQGTGNDFIILDNRTGNYTGLSTVEIANLCDRRFGIGADGLMLLQLKEGYDYEMKYYNADGKEGSLCGNGSRCLAAFAKKLRLIGKSAVFLASDGLHEIRIVKKEWVELKMNDVHNLKKEKEFAILNTGSPHYIQWENNVVETDVYNIGKRIRYSPPFADVGINVNFVEAHLNHLIVRTYERGVEAETYSCGTGVTAAAIASSDAKIGHQEKKVQTKGGELKVKFDKKTETDFENIWLCGPAKYVYKGTISI